MVYLYKNNVQQKEILESIEKRERLELSSNDEFIKINKKCWSLNPFYWPNLEEFVVLKKNI